MNKYNTFDTIYWKDPLHKQSGMYKVVTPDFSTDTLTISKERGDGVKGVNVKDCYLYYKAKTPIWQQLQTVKPNNKKWEYLSKLFFNKYHKQIKPLLSSLGGYLSDEAASTIMFKAINNICKFKPDPRLEQQGFMAWLLRIARNVKLDIIHQETIGNTVDLDALLLDTAHGYEDDVTEWVDALNNLRELLGDTDYEFLVAYENKEIPTTKSSTTRVRIHRIKQRLLLRYPTLNTFLYEKKISNLGQTTIATLHSL